MLSSGDNKANELPSGEIPLVSAGESNNGITKHIKHGDGKAQIFPANILTADMFGNFFYQSKEFYAVSHGRVNMLFPKSQYFSHFNRFIGGFICAYSFKFKSLFGFSNMLSKTKIEKETLELPTIEGKIAFDFMESYIKELEAERINEMEAEQIRELEAYLEVTGLKDYELDAQEREALAIFAFISNTPPQTPPARGGAYFNSPIACGNSTLSPSLAEGARGWVNLQWRDFRIGELFESIELKKLNPLDTREFRVKEQDEKHPIPAVVAKVGNNGIMYYVGKNDFETTKNKLVVIGDGAVASGLVYYQGQEFTILHNAYAIQLKCNHFETRHNYLFLACCLQKAIFDFFGYENKPTWNKVKECKITLPVLPSLRVSEANAAIHKNDIDCHESSLLQSLDSRNDEFFTNQHNQIAFDFMENFISAVQKEVIKSVVIWSEKRIETTKEIVANSTTL